MMNGFDMNNEYIEAVRRINAGKSRKLFVLTFGCQQNEADSEQVRGIGLLMGYSLTETPDDADIIIVNTCAIREHAEDKALSMLGNFKALKRKRPELVVGVIGCMAAERHVVEHIKTGFHYVTFTLEPNMLHLLPEVIYRKLALGKRSFIVGKDDGSLIEGIPAERSSAFKAWVSIMYGCNNFCSYCIVPYTRGRERSRPSESILSECRGLVAHGVKEITLLGQNVNSYKSDMDFATLIENIALLDGDFTVRFMTSHPKDVSDRLIEVMGKYSPKIAPYFHLPLQSGSDRILKLMHRTYNSEKFLTTVRKLREAVPGIALSTDVIVGFPTETDEDFEDTIRVLTEAEFDLVYSFIYSKREGTPAARMDGQVDQARKDERMSRLLALSDAFADKKNKELIGTVQRVLVESRSKRGSESSYTARTLTNKLVHFTSDECLIGEFTEVLIEKAGAFELFGKLKK